MKICLLLQDCKPDHTPVAATQQHRVGKREVPHFIEFKSTKSTTEHTIGSLRDACRLHDAAVAPSVTSLSHGRNADDFMSLLVRRLLGTLIDCHTAVITAALSLHKGLHHVAFTLESCQIRGVSTGFIYYSVTGTIFSCHTRGQQSSLARSTTATAV